MSAFADGSYVIVIAEGFRHGERARVLGPAALYSSPSTSGAWDGYVAITFEDGKPPYKVAESSLAPAPES